MKPTGLDILLRSDLIYMVMKVNFHHSVAPRNLTVKTFVTIDSRILMSNAFFWMEVIIMKFY